MTNKRSQNDKAKTSTIWQKKQIAPFEYCTFDRAARLLNCETQDMIHWWRIHGIRAFVRMENSNVVIEFDSSENYIEDNPFLGNLIKINHFDYGNSSFNSLLADGYETSINENKEFSYKVGGVMAGYWAISPYYGKNGVVEISSIKSIVFTPDKIPEKLDNVRIHFSLGDDEEPLMIPLNELYILKEDIDHIYKSSTKGQSLGEPHKKQNMKSDKLITKSNIGVNEEQVGKLIQFLLFTANKNIYLQGNDRRSINDMTARLKAFYAEEMERLGDNHILSKELHGYTIPTEKTLKKYLDSI